MHGALLYGIGFPEGKIVLFNNYKFKVYNPAVAGDSVTINILDFPDTEQEPFCAGHTMTVDGRLLIAGGNWIDKVEHCPDQWIRSKVAWASLFDPFDSGGDYFEVLDEIPGLMSNGGEMNGARYYPTCTALPDGSILTVAGDFWAADANGNGAVDASESVRNEYWAELDTSNQWNLVTNRIGGGIAYYPNMLATPVGLWWEGKHEGPDSTVYSSLWPWPYETSSPVTDARTEPQRITANMVMMSLAPPSRVTTIALIGGGDEIAGASSDGPHDTMEWITYDPAAGLGAASWSEIPVALAQERRRPDSVILPTGHVLIMGGESDSGGVKHTASHTCEIFDPDDPDTLLAMDELIDPRMYHSQAFLLTDGRVWMSGNLGEGQDPTQGNEYEIFYPPYLFDGETLRTDRPTISSSPDSIEYGQPFFVGVEGDAATTSEVCLIHPSSITHATDMGQRRIVLEFTALDDSTLAVTAPPDSTFGSPGHYMLFVVQPDPGSTLGEVPSEGKFLMLQPCAGEVASGSSRTWAGTVRLTGTFTIQDGASLEVRPGTTVYAASDAAAPVRLVAKGSMDVQGGAGASQVLFTSYEMASGDSAAGTWDGLELHFDGAVDAYGYFGSLEPPSSIVGTTIAHADTAIRFTDLCAPTLDDVTFENIASGIEILLDDTDVMIPSGYWDPPPPDANALFHEVPAEWVLTDTLDVRATSGSSNDWGWPGGTWGTVDEPDEADLLVQGKMSISGTVPNTFLPEVPTSPSVGSDWGGITFMIPSSGNRLYNAHLSGAVNPVRVIGVNQSAGTEIKNCLIEHFRDVGVGIKSSQYVEVSGCAIRRGDDMDGQQEGVARIGISIEESAPRIDDNTIFDTEDLGIQIMNATGPSKFECIAVPANPESLLVTGNQIEAGAHSMSTANGIDAAWICAFYEAQVQENYIEHWPGDGIKMHQCVNTKVSCNQVNECGTAFRFERTDLADQPPVRLEKNNLSGCADKREVVKTDNGVKLKLGPSTAFTGSNKLKIDPQPSEVEWFVTQDDTTNAMNTHSCRWRIGSTDVSDSAVALANMRVFVDSTRVPLVDIDPAPSAWGAEFACWPSDQTPATETRHLGGAAASAAVAEGEPQLTSPGVPFVPGLQMIGANPAVGPVTMLLGVEGTQERAALAVYDVTGRLVRTIRSGTLPGGMHRMVWNLRDDDGRRAAPGVYFLRAERSGSAETRKIVVVR